MVTLNLPPDISSAGTCQWASLLVIVNDAGEVVDVLEEPGTGAAPCPDSILPLIAEFQAEAALEPVPMTLPPFMPTPTTQNVSGVVEEMTRATVGDTVVDRVETAWTFMLIALGLAALWLVAKVVREVAGALQVIAAPFVWIGRRLFKPRRVGRPNPRVVESDDDGEEVREHDLYRFFDEHGDLLYVGISYSAVQRMAQHAADKSWWADVASTTIEKLGVITRAEALDIEREAIVSERPIHNVVHNTKERSYS
jgi:predicted GIY-YIG superfamily endonuclease